MAQPQHIQPQLVQSPLPEGMVRVSPVEASNTHALEMLLTLEAEARQFNTAKELIFFITNETRKILSFRQAFCVQLKGDNACETVAVSGLANVERNAPLIASLESGLKQLRTDNILKTPCSFEIRDLWANSSIDLEQYPFPHLLWMPFSKRDGVVFSGLLMARETPWSERDISVTTRLSSTYAHAWCALVSAKSLFFATANRKPWMLGAAFIALLALFIPIPMSTLAPVEVVSREPIMVAAPIEGVIETIKIEPNTPVKAGDVLLSFQNTTLKNKFDIAERAVQVARAKELKATQSAFSDPAGRHESLSFSLNFLSMPWR